MMTPGPSCMDPRVYRAMSTPLVGHLDPWFLEMMNDVQVLLRRVFQTENRITYPISASGSGGIEAAVLNPLEEGDECIVCSNGMFSERMAVIAERSPAKLILRMCGARGKERKSSLWDWRTAKRQLEWSSGLKITAKSRMKWERC
jgi:aspartate aminotransferase-like enzyme